MAINIYSNGSGSAKAGSKPTSVPTAAGASAKSSAGSILKGVGSIAAKYGNLIPGVGGIVSTIGKMVSDNDPEWWQNVPGTGVSTNIPLSSFMAESTQSNQILVPRPGILEFVHSSSKGVAVSGVGTRYGALIDPTLDNVTTYLMQNIRKVVNAIPLQKPEAYRQVLINAATAYALKHQLDKFIWLTTNSRPHMPSLTDGSYPILQADNYATLVGLRDRLAEYCKASVRLPHTLCQYLAWRFGRAYRMNNSDKAGYILYNVLPMGSPIAEYSSFVNLILGFVANSSTVYWGNDIYTNADSTEVPTNAEKQSANADLFNAYKDHVIDVLIKPETQLHYDPKEFVLRTNLDVLGSRANSTVNFLEPVNELVYMDSALDNKTTFMASTVSTATRDGDKFIALFPVRGCNFHIIHSLDLKAALCPSSQGDPETFNLYTNTSGAWAVYRIDDLIGSRWPIVDADTALSYPYLATLVATAAALCKAADYYNVELYLPYIRTEGDGLPSDPGAGGSVQGLFDLTGMSTDLARCTSDIIRNTQVYAFANLVYDAVKSYAQKEMPGAIKAAESFVREAVDVSTPANVSPVTVPGTVAKPAAT